MKARLGSTLVAFALAAAACSSDASPESVPPLVTSSTITTPTAVDAPDEGDGAGDGSDPGEVVAADISQVDCPGAIASELMACGSALVTIDRTDPTPGVVEITVATMRGSDPAIDTPLVVLQGGPGGASSDFAAWFPQRPFTQVFIDQRGTGFGSVDFDCGEYDAAIIDILASEASEAEELGTDALDACARRLDASPLLDTASTRNHADDVVSVMRGLGYGRYVVYGVSYGSTIGLELLRAEPTGISGVVLDGVYPPDIGIDEALARSATMALDTLAGACAASEICSGYTDDVVATTELLMARLDREPLVVGLSTRETGFAEPIDVVIDGTRLAELSFLLLYSEARLRFLPAVLGGIEAGDESAARWLANVGARTMVLSYAANDEGTFFAVQCNDRLPFTDGPGDDLAPFPAAITSAPIIESCSSWDQPGADAIAGSSVSSDIPTLLLSGEFDPITPAAFAEATAARLSNATVVTQAGRGHGIWIGNDCIGSIVFDFVSDPGTSLDTSCASEGVPVDWAKP